MSVALPEGQPRTVAWLKQRIKNLPDHYPVYMVAEEGKRIPLGNVEIDPWNETLGISSGSVTADLRSLVVEGRLIEAIKLYRERTRCGLKEARDRIYEVKEEL